MSKITGNRSLHFDTLDECMAEAERLALIPTTTVGRFSHSQNIDHLARTLHVVVGDMVPPKIPIFIKWIVQLRRSAILTQPMKPGIKLPSKAQSVFWSEGSPPLKDSMDSLRSGYARFIEQRETEFPVHPLFGSLTNEQHEQLQCRHFELHLGMVVEANQ